jgi:carboxylesterase
MTLRRDAKLLPLLAKVFPGWAPIGSDVKKPGVVEQAYPKLPTRAMLGLSRLWVATRGDLAKITAPLLVFRSREDHVVEPASTEALLAGVSSTDATEVVLENSYHVATLDNDAPLIFERTAEWIRERTGVPAPEEA